ncbi:hypothetical protein ACHAXS_010026 [Conticribra weissflogii]
MKKTIQGLLVAAATVGSAASSSYTSTSTSTSTFTSASSVASSSASSPPPHKNEVLARKSTRMSERRARAQDTLRKMNRLPFAAAADGTSRPWTKLTDEELRAARDRAEREGIDKREHAWLRRAHLTDGAGRAHFADLARPRDDADVDVDGEGDFDQGRRLWGNNDNDPYAPVSSLASNAEYYDKWQQAYRFLGGFIDCDRQVGRGSHDNNQGGGNHCSRWMMWAAYIDPNYSGGEYDEYFGDNPPGTLDCHSPDTEWVLIGVYRQEFYQYIEQISKHLWAIDEYEYIVALAGLEYMTDNECFGVGYDENGNQLYASVQPLEGGSFQMGLYSDEQCLVVNTKTGYTYDDFAEKSELNLGSKDQTTDDAFHAQAYEYWYDTQEYTLTNLNTVYDDFKYCTSCVDYPTYQDGYFIGDDGTDDDDLINQCWKFYSHDSYNCDADCIAMGSQQGTITWISYNGHQFGTMIDGQFTSEHEKHGLEGTSSSSSYSSSQDRKLERLKANLFLTVAGIVFVATFLAFAVARGSSKKKTVSSRSRSRRLLDADYGEKGDARRRSSRSASRSGSARDLDGRSSKTGRSKSRSAAASSARSKSRGSSGRRREEKEYEPPVDDQRRRSQSRGKSSSRRKVDGY